MNKNKQIYRGLPLYLMWGMDFSKCRAKLFSINNTTQTVWIPNTYLEEDGTIKEGVNIMWLFKKKESYIKITKAGYKFTY